MRKAKQGHNSAAPALIKSVISRVEKLEEEKADTAECIKDVFAEAKGNGLDVKVLRGIIKLRKQDADERAEYNGVMKLYCDALGIPDPFS